MSKPRVLVSWSSGKDSAWMLHVLLSDPALEVCGLLTTTNEAFDRVAMHAVRRELLEAQAAATGLPLYVVPLPWPCSNEEYEKRMAAATKAAVERGTTHVAFGDLFLEDVRRYREDRLQGTGLRPLFPLWGLETRSLAAAMLSGGLRAKITCVDPRAVDRGLAGRDFDAALLASLPPDVDPCGERGEFHTFACAGPMFSGPIATIAGEVVERDGFVFADLMLARVPEHSPRR